MLLQEIRITRKSFASSLTSTFDQNTHSTNSQQNEWRPATFFKQGTLQYTHEIYFFTTYFIVCVTFVTLISAMKYHCTYNSLIFNPKRPTTCKWLHVVLHQVTRMRTIHTHDLPTSCDRKESSDPCDPRHCSQSNIYSHEVSDRFLPFRNCPALGESCAVAQHLVQAGASSTAQRCFRLLV